MGHVYNNFYQIEKIRQKGEYNGRPKLLDLGSQDFYCNSQQEFEDTCQLIKDADGDLDLLLKALGTTIPAICSARTVFEALGYDYICTDVDQRDGTIFIDINAMTGGKEMFGSFDFVINSGTSEHIANPSATFFYMHAFAKADKGILFNCVPMFGMGNHGLINTTPKFWHTLQWMNQYEIIKVEVLPIPTEGISADNLFAEHLDFIEGLAAIEQNSHMILAIFRKNKDTVFVPPMDAIISPEDKGKELGCLVLGGLLPFYRASLLSDKEVYEGVNAFLQYNGKEHQYPIETIHAMIGFKDINKFLFWEYSKI